MRKQRKQFRNKNEHSKIEETKNEANYKDTNEEDNISKATIVLSIKT